MSITTHEIWEDFNDAMRGFILRRVREKEAVDDILQEVFIKILKNIDNLKDETKLRSWLYQITRNTIIDYYRYRKPEVVMPETIEDSGDEPEADSQLAKDLSPCVRALMERLPDKYKSAIELTEFEGLTQKEMSDKLGLSLPGAKSRAQRAKEKMKGLLLECCSFELDQRGNILEYQPKSKDSPECCGTPTDSSKKNSCD
jgi:RNA polymerase sigma-70 factor (ECF subfamily)